MKYHVSDKDSKAVDAYVQKAKHKLGVLVGIALAVMLWYLCTYKYEESFVDWMIAKYDIHGWIIPQWALVLLIFVIALAVDTRIPDGKRKQ